MWFGNRRWLCSFFLLPLFVLHSCYKEVSLISPVPLNIISINGKDIFLDEEQEIALYPVSCFENFNGKISFDDNYFVEIDGNNIKNGDFFFLNVADKNATHDLTVTNEEGLKTKYKLKFTLLSIVQITHRYSEIPRNETIPAIIKVEGQNDDSCSVDYVLIKVRGDTSASRKKKSYGFEIMDDNSYSTSKSKSLLGMYHNASWILDAAYVDKSMVRNRVSFELWDAIQRSPATAENDNLLSATHGNFVEVFENGRYAGVFCLCENVDEVLLAENNDLRFDDISFLYKSAGWSSGTKLSDTPDTSSYSQTWGMWEQKYPLPDTFTVWKPLYDYVKCVSNASNEYFSSEIGNYIVIDQAIDLYLFLNLLMASDNLGKNLFMAQIKKERAFYICPWDLDASWGRDWDGDKTNVSSIISFNLYERLLEINPNNFRSRLNERWFLLRQSVLSVENLDALFYKYQNKLILSGAAEREKERWPKSFDDLEDEGEYMQKWRSDRLSVLDAYFSTLK